MTKPRIARLVVSADWAMTDKACRCSFAAGRKIPADVVVRVQAQDRDGEAALATAYHHECADGADLVVQDAQFLARRNGWAFALTDTTGQVYVQDPKEV